MSDMSRNYPHMKIFNEASNSNMVRVSDIQERGQYHNPTAILEKIQLGTNVGRHLLKKHTSSIGDTHESEDSISKHDQLGRAKSGLTNEETLFLHKMHTGQNSQGRNSPVSNKWANSNLRSLSHLAHFEEQPDIQNHKFVFNNNQRINYEIINIKSGLQSARELEKEFNTEEDEGKAIKLQNIYRQNTQEKHEFENEAVRKSLGSQRVPSACLPRDESNQNFTNSDIIDNLMENQEHFQSQYIHSPQVKEASMQNLIKISDQMSVQNLRRNLKQTQSKSAFRRNIPIEGQRIGVEQEKKCRQSKSTQKFKTKLYKDLNKSMMIQQVKNTGQMKINRYMSQ